MAAPSSSASDETTSAMQIERPLGPPGKLTSWDLFKSMGSPRFVVAPMVDQSELAWRVLSRMHGANLCYTPMIHAALFSSPTNARYRREQFDLSTGEEGSPPLDRPVIAQFCANDKETFLQAAMRLVEENGRVDAVDLNLGCPQGIAKRGQYGAFLMEDWALIESLINHLHKNLSVPITAKFRVYDSLEKTLDYARMLERAGAQILTVHGRTRDQKGQLTGLADWAKIKAVKEAVNVPVFGNGNVLSHKDVSALLAAIGVDGVMSAEGNLYNPSLFLPLNRAQATSYRSYLPEELRDSLASIDAKYLPPPSSSAEEKPTSGSSCFFPIMQMTEQYLTIVKHLKTQTAVSAIKAHLFRLWKPIFGSGATGRHHDLRDGLSRISSVQPQNAKGFQDVVEKFVELTEVMKARLEEDHKNGALRADPKLALGEDQDPNELPYSHCQPYLRPLAGEAAATGAPLTANGSTSKRSGPGSEDAMLDAAEVLDVANNDQGTACKRVKLSAIDETLPQAPAQSQAQVVTGQAVMGTILCPSCKASNASHRCVRRVCRTCCSAASAAATADSAEGEGGEVLVLEVCEQHAAKDRKEAEKREWKKKVKEDKKRRAREEKEMAMSKGKGLGDAAAAAASGKRKNGGKQQQLYLEAEAEGGGGGEGNAVYGSTDS